jgi:glutamyl-tRNA reductase
MSFLVATGLSHRSASLDMVERVAVRPAELPRLTEESRALPGVSEVAILSTCNRTELYAVAGEPAAAVAAWGRVVAGRGPAPGELECLVETRFGEGAARHLFRVTAGLDSMVIGEADIQRQVKAAYRVARETGACGSVLDRLFSSGLSVARRIRAEAGLVPLTRSVGSVAVDSVEARLGSLAGRWVVVVGAGKVARQVVGRATARGATVEVCARTPARARRIAEGGRVTPIERLSDAMQRADAVLCCTSAPHAVLGPDALAGTARRGREVTVVDLSIPRNVDAAVASIDGVTLLTLADLGVERVGDAGAFWAAVERAEEMARVEGGRFGAWLQERRSAPLLSVLLGHLERNREGIPPRSLHETVMAIKQAAAAGDDAELLRWCRALGSGLPRPRERGVQAT